MTVRLTLRVVSGMAAICCFVLFFGILGAMGAPGRARHGDFQKTVDFVKDLIELIEGIVVIGILMVIYVLIYIGGFIVLIVNAIREKLKSPVTFSKEESVQNSSKQAEHILIDKNGSSIMSEFFGVTVSGIIDWLGSIGTESEEEESSLEYMEKKVKEKSKKIWNVVTFRDDDSFLDKCETNKDTGNELEKKVVEEVHAVPDCSAPASTPIPRTRRRKKKRRSKKWRKKK